MGPNPVTKRFRSDLVRVTASAGFMKFQRALGAMTEFLTVGGLLKLKKRARPPIGAIGRDRTVGDAIRKMKKNRFSQLAVYGAVGRHTLITTESIAAKTSTLPVNRNVRTLRVGTAQGAVRRSVRNMSDRSA